jgi:Acetyltransferase (GNAT) domain
MPHASHLVVDIPIVETARLRLRPHCIEDFSDCARMWSDANVTRYIRSTPFSAEETWSRLLRYIGHWILLGFGYWAIEEKRNGSLPGRGWICRLQTRHNAIARRRARDRLGVSFSCSWQGIRDRSSGRGHCLGGFALWQETHNLHNCSRERGLHPRCREMWVSGIPAHYLPRKFHTYICARPAVKLAQLFVILRTASLRL